MIPYTPSRYKEAVPDVIVPVDGVTFIAVIGVVAESFVLKPPPPEY